MGLPPVERDLQGSNRPRSLTVGIDLDGVLGDQVADILPRVKARLGIDLRYEDVTQFRLRLGDTDLAREIEVAQADAAYLLNMPPHDGAAQLVRHLRNSYRVILITARPASSKALTERWIEANGFEFDEVINAVEMRKSLYGADVLVDDYTGNIEDFVRHTPGLGVLLSRPWNVRDRDRLQQWIDAGRVVIADTLAGVPAIIEGFASTFQTGAPRLAAG